MDHGFERLERDGRGLNLTDEVRDGILNHTGQTAPRTPEGRIVWSWDAFDHLDVWRFGYRLMEVFWHTRGFPNHLDWTHGNGVSYDPSDDSVIVSLRHQDAVIKIDRATRQIKWILGDHKGWNETLSKKLLTPVI